MEKTYLNYLLIAAFMFFIFSIVLYMFSEGIIKNTFFDNNNTNNPSFNNIKYPENNIPNNPSQDSSSEKSNSENQGASTSSVSNNLKELPSDINSSNCGFYYSEYGVCSGTCPEGKCISEERSCYCKKVN
jgi:hypothetical protein